MKKYLQVVLIWIMITYSNIKCGFLEYVLIKSGVLARLLSGIILSVCIFIAAWLLISKTRNCNKKDYFIIGSIWFVLTNLFGLAVYIKDGGGCVDLL